MVIRISVVPILIVSAVLLGFLKRPVAASSEVAGGSIAGTVIYESDRRRPWRFRRNYVADRRAGLLAGAIVCLQGLSGTEQRESQDWTIDQRNGTPLERRNGAPLRLIVPGWYGIANVKWLKRIEVRDTRYMGRYMGRDYVTVRGERRGGEVVFVETSVNKMNLKSIVARVTRGPTSSGSVPVKAYGAVWSDGTDIATVEVQVDGGRWRPAQLAAEPRSKFSWIFFSIDLGKLALGTHTLVSRAVDAKGRVQPSADDDEIALKSTYWEANQQWPRKIELDA